LPSCRRAPPDKGEAADAAVRHPPCGVPGLRTAGGELRHRQPLLYQEGPGGRKAVAGEYVLLGPREAGFQVRSYDRGRELVIDPVLVYSTYLGGSDDDRAFGIAVDASGCAY